jgi:similar to spore coat protein
MAKELAMHETLEVHEVLIFKTACLAKNKLFIDMVEDNKLKKIIEEDIELSTQAIKDLRKIIADAGKQTNGEEA